MTTTIETELQRLLRRLGACHEAIEWAGERSLEDAWQKCMRADWMLWLCAQMIDEEGWPTHQQIVLAACDCAETALKFVPAGEERPRRAIEVARRWANGMATIEEVRAAANAAEASSAGHYAAYYAAWVADYAAWASHAAYYAAAYYAPQLADLVRPLRHGSSIPRMTHDEERNPC